jgi:hypothetical protein
MLYRCGAGCPAPPWMPPMWPPSLGVDECLELVIHGVEPFHDGRKHCIGGGARARAGDDTHDGGSGPGLLIPKLSPARAMAELY